MNDPIATFPNETYLNGLRVADAVVVDALYNEFRQPIAKAVESAGGSFADGTTFFRVALLQTAELVATGKYPEAIPINLYIKALAIGQYRDWLTEKGMEVPELPEMESTESQAQQAIPRSENLREMRLKILAKRQYSNLNDADQKQILLLATAQKETAFSDANFDTSAYKPSIERYKGLLKVTEQDWSNGLPAWVMVAFTNTHFHQIWSACEAMERRSYSSQVSDSGENKAIRNAFILFVLLTIGYAAYTWFTRDQSPAEVYQNNFQPPASIIEDMTARYAKDSLAPNRPEACMISFQEADTHYKKKEWRDAAANLADMMADSLAPCQSDALFYLAIVGLQLDKPELSLECISKIEDLERYGEELYWYMALAYVKIAAEDPSEKDMARRAVERALSNTEIPERRKQAEKMLEELSTQ
jgi:hypothetical protein